MVRDPSLRISRVPDLPLSSSGEENDEQAWREHSYLTRARWDLSKQSSS
jgi:hypothetical protein